MARLGKIDKLRLFIDNLGKEEKRFLIKDLPVMISAWIQGDYEGEQATEVLEFKLKARSYYKTDAIAIALFHLKDIYKFKIPGTLYRWSNLDFEPKGGRVKVEPANQLKSLLSFTPISKYDVGSIRNKYHAFVRLEWKPIPSLVVANYKNLAEIAIDMQVLTGSSKWQSLLRDVEWDMTAEKEYLVYVNKPILCRYKKF